MHAPRLQTGRNREPYFGFAQRAHAVELDFVSLALCVGCRRTASSVYTVAERVAQYAYGACPVQV